LQQEFKTTAIDNIFVDNCRINVSTTSPIISGLSDHNAQILTIKNIYYATINEFPLKERTWLIDNETIINFQSLLKKETWEFVYIDRDPNHMLNLFLCTFLYTIPDSFQIIHNYERQEKLNYTRNKNILQTQQKSVCLH